MKSFRHFYGFIRIDSLTLEGQGKLTTITAKVRGPSGCDKTLAWLARRKVKQVYLDPLTERFSTVK